MAEINKRANSYNEVSRFEQPSARSERVTANSSYNNYPENNRNEYSGKKVPSRSTPDFTQKRNVKSSKTNIKAKSKAQRNISAVGSSVGGSIAVAPTGMRKKARVRKERIPRERLAKFDYPFFTIVMVLLVFGLVMMFSASYAFSYKEHGDSYFYVSKQIQFMVMGIIAMILISFLDYHIMLNKYVLGFGIGISAILMVFVKLNGVTQGGAERWIEVAGITFQPSEILKFAVIMFFAYFAHERYGKIKDFKKGFMPLVIFILFSCGLTLMQPHLSGTIIIFAIGLIMMFVGNCKVRHIVIMCLLFIIMAALGLMILKTVFEFDYFGDRILSWQNPEADPLGKTYQTNQSLITIGSGGLFGLGLGNSRQKYSYLPASHNDFIFSVICEELGFIGAVLVILLFIIFMFRGFYIASKSRDRFGMMLAVGITAQIGVQALMNIAVVTNSMPNTGISLPFFSYGGSALMMQLAEIGVVLNISRKAST